MNAVAPSRWSDILFDFDGTLVDSSPLHAKAYRGALAEYRPELLDAFDYHAVKGKTTRAGFAGLGVSNEEELDRLTHSKQQRFRGAVEAGALSPLPGARELLVALAATGRRSFLVTSGSAPSVSLALRRTGLADFFAGIVSGDDAPRSKPAPDAFLVCLDRFRIALGSAVAVEDATAGVVAARAAGLVVLSVHDPATAVQADLHFPDLPSLRNWLAVPLCARAET